MIVEKINYDSLNTNYYIKFKKKEFILKRSNSINEILALKLLNKHNKCNSPKLIDYFKYNDTQNILLKYINGCVPQLLTESDFIKLAQITSRLHRIKINSKLFSQENVENLDNLFFYYNNIKDRLDAKENRAILNFLHNINCKYFQELDLPKSIVHSDIKKDNIIKNNNKLYIIDYGNCYYGYRIIDTIRIYMWLILRDKNNTSYFDKYIKKYCEKIKFTPEEIEQSNILYKFCLIYNFCKDTYLFMNHKISKNYYFNTSKNWLSFLDKEFNLARFKNGN